MCNGSGCEAGRIGGEATFQASFTTTRVRTTEYSKLADEVSSEKGRQTNDVIQKRLEYRDSKKVIEEIVLSVKKEKEELFQRADDQLEVLDLQQKMSFRRTMKKIEESHGGVQQHQ